MKRCEALTITATRCAAGAGSRGLCGVHDPLGEEAEAHPAYRRRLLTDPAVVVALDRRGISRPLPAVAASVAAG